MQILQIAQSKEAAAFKFVNKKNFYYIINM
jgi:hypothetical protein